MERIIPLYKDEEVLLGDVGGKPYLFKGDQAFRITYHPYEPCICIGRKDGSVVVVHNAFTTDELYDLSENGGTIRMITGDEYDLKEICGLLLLAEEISEDTDISYLEGRMFIRYLEKEGVFSSDTARDLSSYREMNERILDSFLHAKRIGKTEDGRYYIRKRYE